MRPATAIQRTLLGCGLLLLFSLNAAAQITLGRLSARVSSPLPPFDVNHASCIASAIASLNGIPTDVNGRLSITVPLAADVDSNASTSQFTFRLLVDGFVQDSTQQNVLPGFDHRFTSSLSYTYQRAPGATVVSTVSFDVTAKGGASPTQNCSQSRSVGFLPAAVEVSPTGSAPCILETGPAATLLLPYFQVNGSGSGVTTLFSVNNSSENAVLAHVVVWSDLAVPVLGFNAYLTGYDVQTFNLSEILLKGELPRTASAGQDLDDDFSPQGRFSQDINFASCAGQLPPRFPLTSLITDHLKKSLTGLASPLNGRCAGRALGDGILRGYVTVDTVNNCTLRIPGEIGYFGPGGSGDATNQNVLWGDYFYFDPTLNRAEGFSLVHIGAAAANPETSVAGQYTFYGRYDNWTAADNREPLATSFALRSLNDGPLGVSTKAVVWRDPKVNQGSFTCGTSPRWYPLGEEQVVAFDEEEQAVVFAAGQSPFGAAAQLVRTDQLATPFQFGWLFLNLNTVVGDARSVPPEDPAAAQAWAGVLFEGSAGFGTGFDAIPLDSACKARHQRIGG